MASEFWAEFRRAKHIPSGPIYEEFRAARVDVPDYTRLLQLKAKWNLRSMRAVIKRLLDDHDRLRS